MQDRLLPMQGVWVRSLVRELGFHMPPGIAKKNKKMFTTTKKKQNTLNSLPMETGRKKTRTGKGYKTEEKAKRRRYKTSPTTARGWQASL